MLVTFRGGIPQQISSSLSVLLDSLGRDRGSVLTALGSLPDGTAPSMLSGRTLLVTSFSAGEIQLVVLRDASSLDLEEWLEGHTDGGAGMLLERAGSVVASTEAARRFFRGWEGRKAAELFDPVSRAAFDTAFEGCLVRGSSESFSAMTGRRVESKRPMTVSLRRLGAMGHMVVSLFSPPTLGLSAFESAETRFIRSIFSMIPVPAAIIDSDGTIASVNARAAGLARETGGRNPVGTQFLNWICERDRERVAAIHRDRAAGDEAPFRFRASLSQRRDQEILFEITSLVMPEGDSTLVMFVPLSGARDAGSGFMAGQKVDELVRLLEEMTTREDPLMPVLELFMAGTGATGAALSSGDGRITAGDPSVTEEDEQPARSDGRRWSETPSGLLLSVPVRTSSGRARLLAGGLSSRDLDAPGRLVVGISPLLVEMAGRTDSGWSAMSLLSSLGQLAGFLRGSEREAGQVLDKLSGMVGAQYAVMHEMSGREPVLKPLAVSGTAASPPQLHLEIPSTASWAYTHSETCYVPDTAIDQRFAPVFQSSRSEIAVPLVIEGRSAGTMVLGSDEREAFEPPVPALLGLLGTIVSLWLFGTRRSGGSTTGEAASADSHIGLDDLLLSLSHRMRSPVTVLRGHTDMLLSGRLGPLGEAQRSSLSQMGTALVDLVEYTERLLTFMRIELREERLESVWARPSDVVSALLPVFAEKGESRGITVTAELPSEPFTASFDRSRLEQIVGNLVGNAIRFCEPGGMVSISVRTEAADTWVLEVFNSGEGIPQEDLPHVFDRFYTGSNAEGSARGLGIGLTIVKSFCEQMGGTVSVRTRPGHGTWFSVRLPVS